MAKVIVNGKAYEIDDDTKTISFAGTAMFADGEWITEDQQLSGIVQVNIEGAAPLNIVSESCVMVNGHVNGDVQAEGPVTCGCVRGNLTSKGNVECHEVYQNVYAEGDVNCSIVEGDVVAKGNVKKSHSI